MNLTPEIPSVPPRLIVPGSQSGPGKSGGSCEKLPLHGVGDCEIEILPGTTREALQVDDQSGTIISFGPFRLVKGARLLEHDGVPLPIGSRAFDILALLVEQAGSVVSKRDLVSRGWPDLTVDETSLRVQIVAIRKILGDGRNGARYISNVAGRGYCFVARTTTEAPGPGAISALFPTAVTGVCNAAEDMIGREEVVQRIAFLLNTCRFVTVHGPGGMGKTTVARACIAASAAAFDDNIIFLDIASFEDVSLITSALASALGLVVHENDAGPAILAMLASIRALIVFDSCELAIDHIAALAERIHRDAPGVSLLITSREPLRAVGEHVVQLAPLALPPIDQLLTLDQLLQFPAAKLFAERAFAAGLPAGISDSDRIALANICHSLDGIPLAIEIAASRAGRHGLNETARLLDGRFRLLWQGRRAAPSRHQTLYATLDWSYGLLSDTERVMLQRLSILPGRFQRKAARALEGSDDGSADVILDDLVSKSLVHIDLDDGNANYRLLDTTRSYALEKLNASGLSFETRVRHLGYVSDHLTRTESSESQVNQAQPIATLDLLGDLRVALTWAFEQSDLRDDAVRLAAKAAPFFFKLALLQECRDWLERALAHVTEDSRGTSVEMELEGAYGTVLMLTKANSHRAQEALEKSIGLAEQLDDLPTAFRLLNLLQVLHRRTAEYNRLLPLADKARAMAERLGDEHALLSAQLMHGSAHSLCGDQVAAEQNLRKVVEMQSRMITSPQHYAYLGDARVPLAMTLWLRGLAVQAADAAEAISADTKDVFFSCIALAWAAIVYQTMGDRDATLAVADRLRETANKHALGPYQAVAMAFAGEALIEQGQINDGISHLQHATAVLKSRRYGLHESIFSRPLAIALICAGRIPEAEQLARVHLEGIENEGGAYDHSEWLRILGEAEAASGRIAEAEQTFHRSISISEMQGAISWRLRSSISLAKLLTSSDRSNEAIKALQHSLAPFEEGFGTQDLITATCMLEELMAGSA